MLWTVLTGAPLSMYVALATFVMSVPAAVPIARGARGQSHPEEREGEDEVGAESRARLHEDRSGRGRGRRT